MIPVGVLVLLGTLGAMPAAFAQHGRRSGKGLIVLGAVALAVLLGLATRSNRGTRTEPFARIAIDRENSDGWQGSLDAPARERMGEWISARVRETISQVGPAGKEIDAAVRDAVTDAKRTIVIEGPTARLVPPVPPVTPGGPPMPPELSEVTRGAMYRSIYEYLNTLAKDKTPPPHLREAARALAELAPKQRSKIADSLARGDDVLRANPVPATTPDAPEEQVAWHAEIAPERLLALAHHYLDVAVEAESRRERASLPAPILLLLALLAAALALKGVARHAAAP